MAGSWSGALFYSIGNFVPNRIKPTGVCEAHFLIINIPPLQKKTIMIECF